MRVSDCSLASPASFDPQPVRRYDSLDKLLKAYNIKMISDPEGWHSLPIAEVLDPRRVALYFPQKDVSADEAAQYRSGKEEIGDFGTPENSAFSEADQGVFLRPYRFEMPADMAYDNPKNDKDIVGFLSHFRLLFPEVFPYGDRQRFDTLFVEGDGLPGGRISDGNDDNGGTFQVFPTLCSSGTFETFQMQAAPFHTQAKSVTYQAGHLLWNAPSQQTPIVFDASSLMQLYQDLASAGGGQITAPTTQVYARWGWKDETSSQCWHDEAGSIEFTTSRSRVSSLSLSDAYAGVGGAAYTFVMDDDGLASLEKVLRFGDVPSFISRQNLAFSSFSDDEAPVERDVFRDTHFGWIESIYDAPHAALFDLRRFSLIFGDASLNADDLIFQETPFQPLHEGND